MEDMMGKNEDFLRGLNVEVPIDLTFEEAALGTEKKIEYSVRVQCTKCLGLATTPGHFPILCKTCNGKGFVWFFFFQTVFVLGREHFFDLPRLHQEKAYFFSAAHAERALEMGV